MQKIKLKIIALASVLMWFLQFISTSSAEELKIDERPAFPFRSQVEFEEQCGPVPALQDVELYDGTLGVTKTYVSTHEPSTVQLQWLDEKTIRSRLPKHSPGKIAGRPSCSGTLISDRHVLTAGHCFDAQIVNKWTFETPWKRDASGKPQYALPEVLATLQQVNFRYQLNGVTKTLRTPEVFPIIHLLEYRQGNDSLQLDYAIVELGRNQAGVLPGEKYSSATALSRTATKNEPIAIIQHPNGEPKKIEAGKIFRIEDSNIFYNDIDTLGGSSGSGVRDNHGNIIAVHTHGGCKSDANSGVSTESIARFSDILKPTVPGGQE